MGELLREGVPLMATRKSRSRVARWLRSESGRRWAHRVPALSVAGVAAWVSYWHMVTVATMAGQTGASPYLEPLSVDALMVIAARYITRARRTLGKVWAVTGFILGAGATLTANVLSAQPTALGRAVAAWPAVALVVTAAVLHWGEMRPKPRSKVPQSKPAKPARKLAKPAAEANGHAPINALSTAGVEA